jgi:DNA-binding MarR family transcriptional regulator
VSNSVQSTPCYNLAARRNARALTRLYDRYLAPEGLSSSQYSILAVVGGRDGVTIADLALHMVMERTTLMRAIVRLEADGLLVRRVTDNRGKIALSLTQAGQAKIKAAALLWQKAQHDYEGRVGEQRATNFRDQLFVMTLDG